MPPGKLNRDTQSIGPRFNISSQTHLLDSPNALNNVSFDGSPMPWETSIKHPNLNPNSIIWGMPSNQFADHTVEEVMREET